MRKTTGIRGANNRFPNKRVQKNPTLRNDDWRSSGQVSLAKHALRARKIPLTGVLDPRPDFIVELLPSHA